MPNSISTCGRLTEAFISLQASIGDERVIRISPRCSIEIRPRRDPVLVLGHLLDRLESFEVHFEEHSVLRRIG
jgi:hypothetical protein